MNKQAYIKKLKKQGLFWSYDTSKQTDISDNLFIEQVLKHGDVDDILRVLKIFDKQQIIEIWQNKVLPDERFFGRNYYLARVFFDINDAVKDYINKYKRDNNRYERLKKLTT